MSKRDVIFFLFKWKYSLIGYFLFVVGAVTTLVYLLPQKYAAASLVLVESNRAPVMRLDDAYGVDESLALNSEVMIIRSGTVLSAAVDKLQLDKYEDPPSTIKLLIDPLINWIEEVGLKEPMTQRESWIKKLEDNLAVEPVPLSNVITISFKGKDPKQISEVVNTVTDSYIDHHLKIFSSAGASKVYGVQLERLKRELDVRRKQLADYKRKSDVSAVDETRRALVQTQSGFTSDLVTARNELAELKTLFRPGHTKIALAEERVANIERALSDTRPQLQSLELQTQEITEMELRISSLETSYQEYQKRYEEERFNELASPDVVNVRVIEYAAVPTRPGHSRIFYVIVSVLGGFVLSLAIALIREYFDHRVADPDEVAQLLGVPTLGSVERMGKLF